MAQDIRALAFALSPAAKSVWAKSSRSDAMTWLPLFAHMSDTAGVAARLWDEWLPASTRAIIAEAAGSAEAGRVLAIWLAAIHDLGKATPPFAGQVPELADRMRHRGLHMPSFAYKSTDAPHAACSQVLLERWLVQHHGWDRMLARTYAIVPGGHHGVPPTHKMLKDIRDAPPLLGEGETWIATQDELAEFATRVADAQEHLAAWSARPLPQRAQTVLTGLVIMADWIASGDLIAYDAVIDELPSRVTTAWSRLDMQDHWHAIEPEGTASDLLRTRFGLPPTASARPVQDAALRLVRNTHGPCLLIVEAPMGEGKTELALLAAESLAARTGAGGLILALPTMATSDAIFNRTLRWVNAVPDARGPRPETIFLAHSKARLNDAFKGLAKVGDIDFVDRRGSRDRFPDEAVVAHVWLTGRKRGILSSMVVGTIDQALFAALKSRHVVLRHLALANKVVVIDEVHASDAYMKVYLKRVLRWLGEYGVPVILMSATLEPKDRQEFAEAYARQDARKRIAVGGRRRRIRQAEPSEVSPGKDPASSGSPFDALRTERGYPLLTAVTPNGDVRVHRPAASSRRSNLAVERIPDDLEFLARHLREQLAQGGAVAVIRNTVVRAQQTAAALRDAFGDDAEVMLVHARFIAPDRLSRENDLRTRLGPPSADEHGVRFGERPLIVVGTQVLEQSLDVDFDLMVSDLAPVDLLLQRAGRMHRHSRSNRSPLLAEPRLLITGADWTQDPPSPVRGSSVVYGDRDLLAAVGVLADRWDAHVSLPGDIPLLVADAAEGDFARPESWASAWDAASAEAVQREADQAHRATTFLLDVPRSGDLVDWLAADVGDADDSGRGQAQVRDTDASIEVLVVQRMNGEIRMLPWLPDVGGEPINTDWPPPSHQSYAIAACSLRLPYALTTPWKIESVIRELEANGFAGWQQSPLLRGELVLVLDENLTAELAGIHVRYDREYGLLIGDDAG